MFHVLGGVITNKVPAALIAKVETQEKANEIADAYAAPLGHWACVTFIPED